ncbi:MAG TPA: hypothetical protein DDX98_14640 [Bacteroidales bacterium]|jgi:hypothetical protein|nr:hypothetical protein [Bacteroidales bacterium]
MKKHAFYFNILLFIIMAAVLTTACKKDDSPAALKLSTLVADDIDLNAATAPSNVAADPIITATFSTNVDPASATAANITLLNYEDVSIAIDITVSGAAITITPTERLGDGTSHTLTFGSGLKATNGQMLSEAIVRSFSTDGLFAPGGAVAYWNFEDDALDQAGSYDASAVIDVTYTAGRKADAGKAATFNGTTSIIEVPNGDQLMNTSDFTLSFWVKAEQSGKGHFVMGLGAFYGFQFEIFGDFNGCKLAARYDLGDGTSAAEDLWFPANGDLGWQGWTFCADWTGSGGLPSRMEDKWVQVVCMYNSTTKVGTMYINDELAKTQDFNLWPDGDAKQGVVGLKYDGVAPEVVNELAFGFIQSRAGTLWDAEAWGGYDFAGANHFQGQLDDIRIYHKVLTATEIQLMYDSGKP